MNLSKSEERAYIHHIFANNIFVHFQNFFCRSEISVKF